MNIKEWLLFTATCAENTQRATIDSSVGMVTSYQLGNVGFISRQIEEVLFFPKPSTPTVDSSHPLIQRVIGLCPRAKAAGA